MEVLRDVLFSNPTISPNKEAIVCCGLRLSFSALQNRTRKLSNALSLSGISHGDRVAVLLENCIEYVELFFGITSIGAIIVPLNYRLSNKEHLSILTDSKPSLLITSPKYIDNIKHFKAEIISLKRSILTESNGSDDYEIFLNSGTNLPGNVPLRPEDTAALLYTSGTTSLPKGVMLSHRNYLADYTNVRKILGINSDVVNLQISPLYHAAAQHTFLQIWGGGKTVILDKFDPKTVLELIEIEQINYLFVVPTMLYNIMDHPEIDKFNLTSLRLISYGAAPMTESRRQEAIKRFGNIFVHAYGLTECTAHASILTMEEHPVKGKSIGRGLPGSEVIIANNRGDRVPPNGTGEIRIRGNQVMKGYWNLPDVTAETIDNGWLCTGDIGTWDKDGFITVIDRKKDIIISGGSNIFPKDVEEVLASYPTVSEVAVYGKPDANWGEIVEAAVVLHEGASKDIEALISFSKHHLASFKTPKSIRFMEELPKNPSGKVLKRDLRESKD